MNTDMLNEARPRGYSRRRQRSRRKKSAVTIESIHPGRAPLGICRPSRSVSPPTISSDRATSSEWFSRASENSIPGQSSNPVYLHRSDPLLSESAQQAGPNKSRPFLSIKSLDDDYFGEGKWVDPRATGSIKSRSQISSPGLFPTHQPTVGPDMTIRGTSSSDADPKVSPITTSLDMRGGYYELAGFDELASSQPVALSDLCIRARPRYRGNKNRKPFLHEPEDTIKENNSAMASFIGGLSKPRSRLSALHQLKNGVCNLSGNQKEQQAAASPMYHGLAVQESRKDEVGEQDSHECVRTCYQKNPLSYTNIYDGTQPYTLRHRYDPMSASTFATSDDYLTSQMDRPTNTPRTTNESVCFGSAKVDSRHHIMLSEQEYSQDSPLNLYRASFDHPSDRSPYESLRLQRAQAYLGSVSSTFQQSIPGNQYLDYCSVKQASVQEAVANQNPTEESMIRVEEKPTSIKLPLPNLDLPYFRQPHQEGKLSGESTNPLKDKERRGAELTTAGIPRLDQEPSSGIQQAYIPDPFIEDGDASRASYQEGNDVSMKLAALDCRSTELKPGPAPTHRTDTGNTTLKNPFECVMLEELLEGSTEIGKANGPGQEGTFVDGVSWGPRRQQSPGPPLLGPPNMGNHDLHLTKHTTMIESKKGNIDTWFQVDGRGEQLRRHYVRSISHRYAQEANEDLSRPDPTHAKRMTSLLGNVITNLHAYVSGDRTRQAANFADFGTVSDCYCEPSLGGRRSYFERDPSSLDPWRASSGQDTIEPATGTEDRNLPDIIDKTRGVCAAIGKQTNEQGKEEQENGKEQKDKRESESDTDDEQP